MAKAKHCHHEQSLSGLIERTRAAGLKLTGPRQAILKLMLAKARPATIDELVRGLRRGKSRGCDWSTAYRSLRKFADAGIVSTISSSDGQARYEIRATEPGHHHHHVICTKCEVATPIEACSVAKLEESVAALGFRGLTHRLEFFGVCARCS